MELNASFITSIIPYIDRSVKLHPGQIKTTIEYKATHGMAASFFLSVLSEDSLQQPELKETDGLSILKFLQTEDETWRINFAFPNQEQNFSVDIAEDEVNKILDQNQIQLAK